MFAVGLGRPCCAARPRTSPPDRGPPRDHHRRGHRLDLHRWRPEGLVGRARGTGRTGPGPGWPRAAGAGAGPAHPRPRQGSRPPPAVRSPLVAPGPPLPGPAGSGTLWPWPTRRFACCATRSTRASASGCWPSRRPRSAGASSKRALRPPIEAVVEHLRGRLGPADPTDLDAPRLDADRAARRRGPGVGVVTAELLARLADRARPRRRGLRVTWRGRARAGRGRAPGRRHGRRPPDGRPAAARGLGAARTARPSSGGPGRSTSSTARTTWCPPTRRAGRARVGPRPDLRPPPRAVHRRHARPTPASSGGRWPRGATVHTGLGLRRRRDRRRVRGRPATAVVVVPYGVDAAAARRARRPTRPPGGALAGARPLRPGHGHRRAPQGPPHAGARPSTRWPPTDPDLGLVIAGPDGWGADALTRGHRRQPAPRPHPPARLGRRPTSAPPCCAAPRSTPTRRSTRGSACRPSRPWPPARRW